MSDWKEGLRAAGEEALNLLYPRRCPICEGILGFQEGRVCPTCRIHLPYIQEPLCKQCGKQLESAEQEYCQDCQKGQHLFTEGRSVFRYEKRFRHSVHRMKFQNRREYLDFYAEEMAEALLAQRNTWRPELLIPVPMFRQKERSRGFNQSRLLAEKISRLAGIPVDTGSVCRIRATLPQKELTARERKANLKGAFAVKDTFHPPQSLLLIDDIYTTGATLDAVSAVLRQHGAKRIYFLALCAGNGK